MNEEEEGMNTSNEEEEQTITSVQTSLPNVEFDKLWDSLVFDDNIKFDLLQYINTSLFFSSKGSFLNSFIIIYFFIIFIICYFYFQI